MKIPLTKSFWLWLKVKIKHRKGQLVKLKKIKYEKSQLFAFLCLSSKVRIRNRTSCNVRWACSTLFRLWEKQVRTSVTSPYFTKIYLKLISKFFSKISCMPVLWTLSQCRLPSFLLKTIAENLRCWSG